jgi:uncharacterized SAM-binding protein YcdF (DUF218 family)
MIGRRVWPTPSRCTLFHRQTGGILSSLVSLLFLLVFLIALYIARRPLLRLTAESWIVEDPLQQSDAIVVLSDDNFFADRATRASELFRQHLAPVIVASGRRLRPNAGVAELMEHDLLERGVPKDHILRYPHDADNTREEAEALAPLIAEHNWHSVIVVTSNYHTRRARYIFQRVLPSTVTVRIASARDGEFDPEHWWERRKSLKSFTRELAAMVVALWELHGDAPHRLTQRALPKQSNTFSPSALVPRRSRVPRETTPFQSSILVYTG